VFLSVVGLPGTRKVKAAHTTAKHLTVMIFKILGREGRFEGSVDESFVVGSGETADSR